MKIAFINVTYGQGSTGNIVRDLAEACKSEGHEVLILYGRGSVQKDAKRIATPFETKIDALCSRCFDNQGFNSFFPTRRAIKLLRAFKPDIINLHNLHGYFLNLPVFFKYLSQEYNGEIVWTLHDCWAFTGHCGFPPDGGCQKWEAQKGCYDCPYKNRYPKSIFLDNSSLNWRRKAKIYQRIPANKMVVVSPSQWLSAFISLSLLRKFPVKVINNGIDTSSTKEAFKAKTEKKENQKKVVLAVANVWDERKGIDDIIKLSKMLPSEKYEIRLVGEIKKKIIELPLNIKLAGRIDSKESLYHEYTKADVFVNPTREDNFPTVNLESICCGTPVVAYDVGGVKETIKSKNYGTVTKQDIVEFAQEVQTYAQSPIFTPNWTLYDKKFMCQQYLSIFSEFKNKGFLPK